MHLGLCHHEWMNFFSLYFWIIVPIYIYCMYLSNGCGVQCAVHDNLGQTLELQLYDADDLSKKDERLGRWGDLRAAGPLELIY